ncbi:MAG: hypothetical protein PHI12_06830 [Dehalococcoidales bacterium]|nr:hypothetical protein [Dehalococcoidales bacterium]
MLIMCDIDGCLADVRGIVSKYLCELHDWDEYFKHQMECEPITLMTQIISGFSDTDGNRLVLMTGRRESVRHDTQLWLHQHLHRQYECLLMRPLKYHGPTLDLKREWILEYHPDLIIDDDPEIVAMAAGAGFVVFQVHGYRWSGVKDYTPGEYVPARDDDGQFSFIKNRAYDQTAEQTLLVLMSELGNVVEYHHKANIYGADAYYSDANQQKEMGDLISMARYFCEQKGWDYEKLKNEGESGYLERMEDIRKHGIRTN